MPNTLMQANRRFDQALALSRNGHIPDARRLLEQLLASHPHHVPALCLQGTLAMESRDLPGALELFERAAAREPRNAGALFNVGWALQELGRWDDALAAYDAAIALDSHDAAAHSNRGVVLQQRGRLADARRSWERALALEPDGAPAHYNLGCALLLAGDYDAGWPHYEWRRRLAAPSGGAGAAGGPEPPLWLGHEALSGKTIALRSEQGFGDVLQFCRYVTVLAQRGAEVVLEAPGPLLNLLADLDGLGRLLKQGGALPRCDYQCPLLSLPLAFRTTLDTIPCRARYLRSDAGKVAEWRRRLGPGNGPRIGLVWSGSVANANDRARSLPLAQLLAGLPRELCYVSLQKDLREGDAASLAAASIANFADELHDFSDTAALCDCLDLVVSVDTSVAHLNGALGNPTWVLLPVVPSWRWLLERSDSPWYPKVRLYRQAAAGAWTEVLGQVAVDLRRLSRRVE